ncbi:hypothetical protein EV702DRAFT_1270434 [Suillus placidus]|uniref:Uncharacterized protein n=1 Tax=Suillus placidus TaxID=48579 RepID=A0A9P7CYN4_9AGAM|nr:hypothetical protein EV702DRAFT_1270434 [Suillus placidus]
MQQLHSLAAPIKSHVPTRSTYRLLARAQSNSKYGAVGTEPCGLPKFDRKLRTDETAYEWWNYLNKDRSGDAQPIARLAVRIFALVPNSMADLDERTGSIFTWPNSRAVQIHGWYK